MSQLCGKENTQDQEASPGVPQHCVDACSRRFHSPEFDSHFPSGEKVRDLLNDEMGFAVRVRSAGQKYGPTCHQRDRADVTEFVTLVRLSSLGQHVGVLALAGYKRRKSALTAGPIGRGILDIRTKCSTRSKYHKFKQTLTYHNYVLGPFSSK